jgi:Fe-S-cluster containining protein
MEDSRKIQSIVSQEKNPRQWFEAYLRNRAYLASFQSDFHCDSTCTRPGCKNQDLQVPVSIIDLVGAAMHRNEPVSVTYKNNYFLGLIATARENWHRVVTLRLQKPCPFLENDRCHIYPVRPLPCILFPEYLVHEGTIQTHARKELFKDYLCLQEVIPLSPERAEVITQLRRMLVRESLASSFYLFNRGAYHIDFSKLIKELTDAAKSQREEELTGGLPLRIIPNQVLEHFFLEHIGTLQPFNGVTEKIHHLDTQEGQEGFIQYFQDDLLIKNLKTCEDDRAFVYRYVKGKLQAKRRSLSSPEFNFY